MQSPDELKTNRKPKTNNFALQTIYYQLIENIRGSSKNFHFFLIISSLLLVSFFIYFLRNPTFLLNSFPIHMESFQPPSQQLAIDNSITELPTKTTIILSTQTSQPIIDTFAPTNEPMIG